MNIDFWNLAFASVLCASAIRSQADTPLRTLGRVLAVSTDSQLRSVTTVRALANGQVLVHDLTGRRLVVLDSALRLKSTIVDSTAGAEGGYLSRLGGLMAFRGDSSLFIDPQSISMLVIDPAGRVARILGLPRPNDAEFMIGGPFGSPGVDPSGRLVYRGAVAPTSAINSPSESKAGSYYLPQAPDTAPIVRVELSTRRLDTAAFVHTPSLKVRVTQVKFGYQTALTLNPMPIVDDWALLSDGRIAVVRGRDYHVDWRDATGQWTSTAKVPYRWERLDEEQKQLVVDSVMAQWTREREAIERVLSGTSDTAGGSAPDMARLAGREQRRQAPNYLSVPAKELPDYRPAFSAGSVRVDTRDNLWVRTTSPSDAGAIYDVIDSQGKLVDRVKLPYGRLIAGFGAEVVYLGVLSEGRAIVEVALIR